jgi:hypothetical protein
MSMSGRGMVVAAQVSPEFFQFLSWRVDAMAEKTGKKADRERDELKEVAVLVATLCDEFDMVRCDAKSVIAALRVFSSQWALSES